MERGGSVEVVWNGYWNGECVWLVMNVMECIIERCGENAFGRTISGFGPKQFLPRSDIVHCNS